MRILCLTPWFPNHREEQQGNFILDSVESLISLGHELTVLATHPWRPAIAKRINRQWTQQKIQTEQFSPLFNLHTCRYLSIPRSHLTGVSFWFYQKRVIPLLEKLVRQYQCDVIHAHTELPGVAAVAVGKKLHIPTLVTLHGISTEKKLYQGKNRKLLFESTLSNADRVLLVGHPLLEFSKQFVATQQHFRIAWNGFRTSDKNTLAISKKWPDNFFRFISVSNLQEGKGIDLNIHAFYQLKKRGMTHWTYKIVGDGEERKKLETCVKQLNLEKHIIFCGACDHHHVYDHLATADIFTLPSYREAFGVAYLEAMSFGLLTLGVRGQGAEAFIEHDKTGLLIEPNNIDVLANTFENILLNKHKMQEMAYHGKQHVHQHFTWRSHAVNLTKIYEELGAVDNP